MGKFETVRALKYLVRGMEYSPLNKRSQSPYRFTQTSEINGGWGVGCWEAILNGRRPAIKYKISKINLKVTVW